LDALRSIAADLLSLSSARIDAQIKSDALREICHDYQH